MIIKTASEALRIANQFIVYDYYGPYARSGSFRPLQATYDESNNRWLVKCKYEKGDEESVAEVTIDGDSGRVIGFKVLEQH